MPVRLTGMPPLDPKPSHRARGEGREGWRGELPLSYLVSIRAPAAKTGKAGFEGPGPCPRRIYDFVARQAAERRNRPTWPWAASVRNPQRKAQDEKNAANTAKTPPGASRPRGRQRSTQRCSRNLMNATYHVVDLQRSQTLSTTAAMHSRGRGARGAPHIT